MKDSSTDDLLSAFDSIGGQVVQPMALRFALEKRGISTLDATEAINAAIADGVLGRKESGGLFLRTKLPEAGQ